MSVGSSYKPSNNYLTLSLGARHIEEYFKKMSRRKKKFIKTQEDKYRSEERRKKMRVKVREKLVVGFWELIPM